MNGQPLTSVQNVHVKQASLLRERRERDERRLFLIEGYREILRAVDAGWKIDQLFICPDLFLGSNESLLIARLSSEAQIFSCSERVFDKLSYRDRPDGLLAVAPQRVLTLDQLGQHTRDTPLPFYVVAEAIEKPGNLGTILRSSDAAGVSGLIVSDPCTDIFNPNVVRASVGTLFTVPTVQVKGEEALPWLKNQGILIVAATPQARDEFTEVDLVRPLAIAVGTEQLGLSDRWMREADIQVRIPMKGAADSLNVAMATTLLLYEGYRQRERAKKGP